MSAIISGNAGGVLSAGTSAKQCAAATKQGYLQQIIVTRALVGTLTIVGLRNEAGVALNLVLPIGFIGSIQPGCLYVGGFTAQKSSASDDGAIIITWSESN